MKRMKVLAITIVWVIALLAAPPAGTARAENVDGMVDFNGDGYADLAIGVPAENIGTAYDAGAVNVLYGSAGGLSAAGDQFWHQNISEVQDNAELYDNFGYSLATGNFGKSSHADLAVGAPFEDLEENAVPTAGAVNVLYGSANGLSAAGNQFWHQNSLDVEDSAEAYDYFGYHLAAGNPGSGSHTAPEEAR